MKASVQMFSAFCVALVPGEALSLEVGFSDYKLLPELAATGFEPFSSSGRNGEMFAMRNADQFYACYGLDNSYAAQLRQEQMDAEVNGGSANRKVQNIPVICVKLQ
ncbi:hypothetical protein [Cypionkella sp.]|uniref:hypothetical protein n=1 Tax=Cypionkella sp. TaxID=2811411 RepID=UPI002ABB34C5|nr:hypothetical protein [Cypionkella sp.]MDZ4395195.1 hypothetical protein [Cypionkella sp.]